ncbi:undecaprenyl-phosphate glucose phosphotransferase [Zoogloea sp.]|uniref:undecaprenyl-phosphate glucose phosphotransferase n=1 Tax=Zoogloea sp. TaxID=49181 RepID=UPI001ACD8470|nr:undecaprenyl-phosphate glucose phosphotransferase [Zoogloea sp.]MBN8282128.1 undecaprenyl-phosphate glucose phosphotransferase [Zoogloea sp.]
MFSSLDNHRSFLRPSYSLTSALEALLDPVVAMLSLAGCVLLLDPLGGPHYILLAVMAFGLLFPGNAGFHEQPRRVIRKIGTNWLLLVAVLGGFGIASGYVRHFPRTVVLSWVVLAPLAMVAAHFVARVVVLRALTATTRQRTAIVAGVNDVGLSLARQFKQNPYLGCRVVGFFDDRNLERLPDTDGLPTLGTMTELPDFVKLNRIDQIYLAVPMATQPRILSLLDDLKDTTASIFFVPDIFVTDLIQGQMHSVGSTPVVAVCETPFTGLRGLIKRASDIVISAILLVLLLPVMLVLAIGVKLSSPGPVIFKQRRYGLDGQEILVYKFRSMTTTDNGNVVKQATKNDARITPFGAFIRKTSLDELPQFINVLQGRMSIVGPRPHAVAHNETYRKIVKGYMIRHKVKPGITGWAQVSGYRGETDTVDKMEKRIEYDLEYLRNWSLGFDLWIIFKTVAVVFKDKNAY